MTTSSGGGLVAASLRELAPDLGRAWEALSAAAWDVVDPLLLELCRLRAAQLIGSDADQRLRHPRAMSAGLTEATVAELPRWPTSPLFTPAQRSGLGFAEQFVIDVSGIEQRHVDELSAHMTSEQVYAFVSALWVLEAMQRAHLVLGLVPTPATIGVSDAAVEHL